MLIRLLFGATILLSVCLVKWGAAGIPFRSLLAIALLALVAAVRLDVIAVSLREAGTLLAIIVICAVLGVVSSLLNGADLTLVGQQLLEIHVQAIVGVLGGVVVRRTCGAQTIMYAFALAVGLSASMAILQFMGVGAAWEARRFVGALQEEGGRLYGFAAGARARGLSFSPVILATQLCLLFAAVFAYRWRLLGERIFTKADAVLLLVLAALAAAAIVSGNRSPLVGMLAFFLLYIWITQRRSAILLVSIGVCLSPLILALPEALRGLGLRIGETEDGSAVGRTVLQVYGLMLFGDRPYGYGLTFDSTEHWADYWRYLHGYANANAITAYALHNYPLMILNKYGFPIVLVGAVVFRALLRHKWAALAFIPYAAHIFFHNDGPLMADFLIWYIIPMYAGLSRPVPHRVKASRGIGSRRFRASPWHAKDTVERSPMQPSRMRRA